MIIGNLLKFPEKNKLCSIFQRSLHFYLGFLEMFLKVNFTTLYHNVSGHPVFVPKKSQ